MIARIRQSEMVRHSSLVFGGVAVASVFNYVFFILIGRRVSVETYGVVTAMISALLVISAPATVVQIITARLAADLHARGDNAALRRLADFVMTCTAIVALAGTLILIALRDPLAAYFNLTSSGPIVITAITAGLIAVVIVQRGVFQGAHRFGDYSLSLSIDAVARVLLGVPLVTVMGASGAILGIAVSLASAGIYSLYAFRAQFGRLRAPLALDRSLIKRVIGNVGLGQLTMTVLMYYDLPLIKHAFDARSAGLYGAAALVGRAVVAASSFIPTLVMPKATSRAVAGLSPLPLLIVAIGLTAAIAVTGALFGIFAPHFVVTTIAGRAFGDAAPLVLPYILASGVLSIAYVIATYKMGLHQYDFVVPSLVIAIVEISVFSCWHPSLLAAILVLLCGHVGVLCATLYRLNAPVSVAQVVAGV